MAIALEWGSGGGLPLVNWSTAKLEGYEDDAHA
jgi:hypothetical protein